MDDDDKADRTTFQPDDFNRQDVEMESLVNHKYYISEDNIQTFRESIVTGQFLKFDAKQMVSDPSAQPEIHI